MKRIRSRLFVPALLMALCACSGGGSGSGGGGVDPAIRETEPNDTIGDALDLGVTAASRVSGTIAAVSVADGLAAGDPDHFRFTPSVTGFLTLALTLPVGSDFDLSLFDGAGVRLATARRDNLAPAHGGTERLYHYVYSGRSYVVGVAGFGGNPGDYTLAIEVAADPQSGPVGPILTTTGAVGSMNSVRSFHAAAALPDGSAIVAGGTTTAVSRTAAILNSLGTSEIYVPATESFAPGPAIGGGRFGLVATALPGGRVLLAGGDLAATAAVYDFATGTMERTDIPLADGMRFLPTATLLPDGRVLLAGGVRVELSIPPTAVTLDSTELFDPKSLTFSPGPPLLFPRISHAACLLADGTVLVAGGEGRSDTEVVDVAGGVFASRTGPSMNGVRDDHTATFLPDGRVLLTGGQDGAGKSRDDLSVLDDTTAAATSTFRLLSGRLSDPRADHVAVLLPSGQALLIGGENDPGTGAPDLILATADLFDTATESVTPMPNLATGRDDHRAVRLRDGRILITGGENAASLSIADAEAYAPK